MFPARGKNLLRAFYIHSSHSPQKITSFPGKLHYLHKRKAYFQNSRFLPKDSKADTGFHEQWYGEKER